MLMGAAWIAAAARRRRASRRVKRLSYRSPEPRGQLPRVNTGLFPDHDPDRGRRHVQALDPVAQFERLADHGLRIQRQ